MDADGRTNLRFLLVTAHDVDYKIGFLCSVVNEAYCKKHGYGFLRVVQSRDDMCKLSSGRHLAWAKVALLRYLLSTTLSPTSPTSPSAPAWVSKGMSPVSDFDYVVWIDADAMVLNHALKLEHFVTTAQEADFIIGEDMADTDFLNTGLMFFRARSAWCQDLLQKWWDDSDARWHHEVCWDQTGLCGLLQTRGILGKKKDWFSWHGGLQHKHLQRTFVFDCGSFNFKYINNCNFVFHAVGERELLFSFSCQLMLKKDRLEKAVRHGFVANGQDVAELEELEGSGFLHLHPEHVDAAKLQLQQALQFWRAFGTSCSGTNGQPPPCSWGLNVPLSCDGDGDNLTRSSVSEAVLQMRETFSTHCRPVLISAGFDSHQSRSSQLSPAILLRFFADMPVRLVRLQPEQSTDRTTCGARFWQLWAYAAGCPPPFSPLSSTSYNPWCLRDWRPWQALQSPCPLLEVAAFLPPWMHQAFPELAIEKFPALDVEPPHSEMPPRASAHDSQALRTHASQAYAGTKPGVLVTPCVVVVVWKTYCSYGLIVFSSAQILGMY
ncbi:unnamed protein product [Symbiodinium natans]|uniref:Nucleotide-diphospho-sugar transferase domain-containing protein n=1 Tax=Symbiodinium natans TaxID=878477 RepID=A0A812V1J2_9DINO|nr:unnamed protein product [Symbiodinium natans]